MSVASRLRTLGTFELQIDGRVVTRPSTQKARALLAFLAIRRGVNVARDEIVEVFWPDSSVENARQSLKTALWSIRRTIRAAGADPNDLLRADNAIVCWHAPIAVDSVEFEQLANTADPRAIAVYAGDFLPGDYDLWTSSQREHLLALLESLLCASLAQREDITVAQRLLAIDPFNEAAYAALIEAEIRSQRIIAAQTLLQRFHDVLRENGLEPSAEFDRRFGQLEAQPAVTPLATRFIGRSRELAIFERACHAADPTPIVLYADAGFGKSALLERFARNVADSGRSVVSLTVPRERSGFGGWEELYTARTHQPFEGLAADRAAGFADALATAIVRTFPAGTCLFVDDAHYLEGDAAYVTGAVAAHARRAGISLVIATRPEGLGLSLSMLGDGPIVEMQLGGLSEEEIRSALCGRAGSNASLAERLYQRTGGHPLFLQRLLERIGEDEQLELPASVRALVESRLRERGEQPYVVAAMLALDPHFESNELAAILNWPEAQVLDAFDDLLALGVLRERKGEACLEFTHDLVMEVARDSLSSQRRRRLHRAAAELLSEAIGLRELARAAEHLTAAGKTGTAAERFVQCAELAYAVFEPRNALGFAERAATQLQAIERDENCRRLWLRLDLAKIKALNVTGDSRTAERIATEAIVIAGALADSDRLLDAVLLRMRSRQRLRDFTGVRSDAEYASELATRNHRSDELAAASLGLLAASETQMRETDASEHGRRAFEAALAVGDTELAMFAAAEVIRIQGSFWNFSEALEMLGRAEPLLEGEPAMAQPNLHYSAAQLMYDLGRYDEAKEHADRGLRLLREPQRARSLSKWFFPDRQGTLMVLHYVLGRAEAARRRWDPALDEVAFLNSGLAMQPAYYRPAVAYLHLDVLLGRNQEGDGRLAKTLLGDLDRDSLPEEWLGLALVGQARVAARLGDSSAPALIESAIECVGAMDHRCGLDLDSLSGALATAAQECGDDALAARARAVHDRYAALRRLRVGPTLVL